MEFEVCTASNRTLCKINVSSDATIKDLKQRIFSSSKIKISRQSLRVDAKGRDLKNDLTVSSLGLRNGSKLYVKDLGPQVGWRFVFLMEYIAPLLIYSLVFYRPQLFYNARLRKQATTREAKFDVPLIMWSFHFSKRVLETIFIHRFSHGTMPLRNLFKNCSYYWGFALYIAYHTNHPLYKGPSELVQAIGAGLFTICELGNLSVHLLLRDLRPPGTTKRAIPLPNANPFTYLFALVSCPNYTYEVGAWIGFTIATSCLPASLFMLAGFYQMSVWALGKHKNYKAEFKNYPKNRKAIVPFFL